VKTSQDGVRIGIVETPVPVLCRIAKRHPQKFFGEKDGVCRDSINTLGGQEKNTL